MPSGSPPSRSPSLRWSNWNLLLLVPLLVLVTPVYNRIEPRVLGFPFFYWYQFLWVPIGVICTSVVYLKTRDDRKTRGEETRGEETRGEETRGEETRGEETRGDRR